MARGSSFDRLGTAGDEVVAQVVRGALSNPNGYTMLKKLAKPGKIELASKSGFDKYIKGKRARIENAKAQSRAKSKAKAKKSNGETKAKAVAPSNGAQKVVQTSAGVQPYLAGYYICPDGRIWTPSVEDAVRLSEHLQD